MNATSIVILCFELNSILGNGKCKITLSVLFSIALYGYCTNADRYGCYRAGKDGVLPPVMSGKITSKNTIRFGKVEVRARTPRGDWIWPGKWK